jgi:hypothetical protein
MDLYQHVERSRFLGRELLLHLWFETEIMEGTLSTKKTGSFGMWVEKEISLSVEKETTKIRGGLPAKAREAKEALLLGKMPEKMGFRLVRGEREASFVLRGDTLSLSAVALPTVLEEEEPERIDAPPERPRKKPRERNADAEMERVEVEAQESFFERMHLLREVEEVVEALYSDFLALRLGPAHRAFVADAIVSWVGGTFTESQVETYVKKRKAALASAALVSKRT